MSKRVIDAANAAKNGKNQSVLHQEWQLAEMAANRTHKQIFAEMDKDSSGGLSQDELRVVLIEHGDYPQEQSAFIKLFQAMDTNKDLKITFKEAEVYNTNDEKESADKHRQGEVTAAAIAEAKHIQTMLLTHGAGITDATVFSKMDKDASGGLSQKELADVLRDNGDYKNKAATKKLFKAIDANKDGKISLAESEEYEKTADA